MTCIMHTTIQQVIESAANERARNRPTDPTSGVNSSTGDPEEDHEVDNVKSEEIDRYTKMIEALETDNRSLTALYKEATQSIALLTRKCERLTKDFRVLKHKHEAYLRHFDEP